MGGKRRPGSSVTNNLQKISIENGYIIGKVRVDCSNLSSKDSYSEGVIENELLEIAREGRISAALHADSRWSVLYHFTEIRENLLSWLPENRSKRVLEIGSGCGAVTGALCRKFGSVDCVELSERRAEIAAWRWADCDNLTIHVGNLNDMSFPEKFDCVTLIGVLEYAASFTHDTSHPYQDFLLNCRQYLKETGTLVIAIENRIGLKYWAGAWEDHTGDIFDGLLGYPTDRGVRTFSRKELSNLLDEAGLYSKEWFYPYPDYKLPSDIYSDRREPTAEEMMNLPNLTFDRERYEFFSEKAVMANLLSTGLFSEFSNSFLVLCGGDKRERTALPLYCHYSPSRKPEYRISTEIVEENGKRGVRKTALTKEARKHLITIEENYRILCGIYGSEHVAESHLLSEDVLEMEYIEGTPMTDLVLSSLREEGIDGLARQLDFLTSLVPSYPKERLGNSDSVNHPDRIYDVDLNFDNIIIRNGIYVLIDYEWLLDKVPDRYLEFRCAAHFSDRYSRDLAGKGISMETLFAGLDIGKKELKACAEGEVNFTDLVLDPYSVSYEKKRIDIV
ncbi:MAG: methyltransferase domain-containing protein [Lachnospiraceae bacterium]|nr:methyltransferase domain-containing protein [Lachnospiraceae bacterium]